MLIRGLLWCCARLPLRGLHWLGKGSGWLWYRLPTKARDTTRKNLRHCFPGRSEQEIQAWTRDSLNHTACTALEMGKAWAAPIAHTLSLVQDTSGYDDFRRVLQSDQGVILLAPHLGNWEIFGFHACRQQPAHFMYQPPRIAALDRLLREARGRTGVQLAPTNRQGVAQVLAALRRGELVGILPDQVPEDASGLFAPFYGQPAFTMTLVSRLVQRTGARVFCGYARRLPSGRGFQAVFLPAAATVYSSDLAESVAGLNRTVEQAVNQALTQYQWEYKRFRCQPDNREFYRRSC